MNALLYILEKECRAYLDSLKTCPKGYFLYRGFKEDIELYRKFHHNMDFRAPVNTSIEIHDQINSAFEHRFGWKIRNGVFCYGHNALTGEPLNLGYGKQFFLFPIGDFDFVYSPEHFDIYQFVTSVKVDKGLIEKIDFRNDSIKQAIESGEQVDELSNEISVNVSTYYLVNTKLTTELISLIWG